MKRAPTIMRSTLGGAICGGFVGIFGGGLVGAIWGALTGDISFGLDVAVFAAAGLALAGGIYGLASWWPDEHTPPRLERNLEKGGSK
jgi:hypothetical protein